MPERCLFVVAGDRTAPGEPEFLFLLIPCCHASGKGLYDEESEYWYVGCRGCYAEVDPKFGAVLTDD
ncbi:hypothetical protein [Microbacterium trichothecenolyticum]|uniref:Uncharacterized protein n=1 Tax=Microbacterium trichothecenolyticum TaxID=69370 RepID=A0A0M2H6Y5_MICTR|nr:hypothetical protein [Microbacterium trichothecenolyticum]KJL42284.1 hypothetical protein RS82_02300 [Microbacterium trichothecenolyticum]